MRRILSVLIVLIVLSLIFLGYRHFFSAKQDASHAMGPPGGMKIAVDTARVVERVLANQFETVGSLRADEAIVVRPEIAGKIKEIHFAEGQRVAADSLLFSLDSALTQVDLNEANANLDNSRRANARAAELGGKQLIARADIDTAKAALSVDEARAASARTRLEKTRIRAPFEGVIGLREVSVGDYVTVGQALVELVRLDPMEVDFRVPEVELGRVAVGQNVNLMVDAFPGQRFSGAIVAIAPTIDAAGRSALLRARIANPELKLRPGLFARVVVTQNSNPKALMIPEQAIWPNGDQKMVFRVEQGVAKLVPVMLGVREPGWVEAIKGLKAGDEVVTAGQMKLQDGMPVMAMPRSAEAKAQPPGQNDQAP